MSLSQGQESEISGIRRVLATASPGAYLWSRTLLAALDEAIRERDEARGFARSAEFHLGEVWDDGRMEHAEDCPEDDTCDCGVHKGFVYLARARGPSPARPGGGAGGREPPPTRRPWVD